MKQVKFRAWEKSSKEMIEVYDIDFAGGIINFNTAWRGLEEVELMQYTGLKDKNGKERYFDDIVKITWRKDTDSYLQQGDDYIENVTCKTANERSELFNKYQFDNLTKLWLRKGNL